MVEGHSGLVEINLGEHEIAGQDQPFGCVITAFTHAQARPATLRPWHYFDRIHQALPVKPPVVHASMQRIPQEVIDPIRVHLAVDQFPPEQCAARASIAFE